MTEPELFDEACDQVTAVVLRAAGADLTLPTPCGWDLGTLVNHFAGTTAALARVGARLPLDPDDPWGAGTEVTTADWPERLSTQLADLVSSWSAPEGWQGTVTASGPEMPAIALGEMALAEVVLHGWDLARATHQELQVSPALGAEVFRSVAGSADLGRQMGAYGPAVEVAADASDLDRALGAAGRDPGWPR